jgi:two-component system sensor histidine kinase RpfC
MSVTRLIRLDMARPARTLLRRIRTGIARARAAEPLEFEQIIVRYLVGLPITAYAVYSYLFEGVHQRVGLSVFILILCAWILGVLLLLHLAIRPERKIRRRAASIIGDAVAMSLLLGLGEKTAALFFPVYLWVILGNGFRYGIPYLYAAIAANFIGFVTMVLVTPYWREAWQFSAGLAAAIIVIPLYVAKLIRNLRHAMNVAEEASRAKTEFLSMMSHELRTPLTAILGLAHVSKVTAATANERFSAISTELAASRLLRMLDTILKFQRIESGAAEREDKAFDILELLNEVRAITEPLAQTKGLDFRIRFTGAIPGTLQSDPDHVQTIILNLVTNAVKYTIKGSVSLCVGMIGTGEDLRLRISIRDTGTGISQEAQLKIFDRFVRAQEHNTAAEPGVGLGLAMCRSLTELLGGRLDFESTPGVGSHFWAELPMVVLEDAPVQDAEASPMAPILLIGGAASDEVVEAVGATAITEADALRRIAQADGDLAGLVLVADADLVPATRTAIADVMSKPGQHPSLVLISKSPTAIPKLRPFATAVTGATGSGEIIPLLETVSRWHRYISKDFGEGAPETVPLMRRLTVLLADDNELNRQVVRRMLELDGHDVVLASTGDEALQQLLDGGVDVALIDVNMPGMSGIDVSRAYKTGLGSTSLTPLLALTADISEQTRKECLAAGMVDVLPKPLGSDQLRESLRRHVPGAGGAEERSASAIPAARPEHRSSRMQIDERRIAALRDLFGEEGVRDHFLSSFERDLVSSLARLRHAAESGRPQLVRDAIHAIKSSASTAGAQQILDDVNRFQREGVLSEIPDLEARIEDAFGRYCMAAFGERRKLPTGFAERSASVG